MSESIIYVNGKDWIGAIQKLEQSKRLTAQAADKALAEIGSSGRKIITEKEERVFHFGERQYKGSNSRGEVYTRYDASLGGWKSTSDGRRLSGFKFESSAYSSRRVAKYKAVSQGRIYSNISNLWDKPTKPYSKASPFFARGTNDKFGRWAANKPRPAYVRTEGGTVKPTLTWNTSDIRTVIGSSLAKTGEVMVKRLEKELNG